MNSKFDDKDESEFFSKKKKLKTFNDDEKWDRYTKNKNVISIHSLIDEDDDLEFDSEYDRN